MNITLALGGGGTKGYAHIGVLKVLLRAGLQVRGVAGTSMGGIIGIAFAAGYSPPEIEAYLGSLDPDRMYARDPEEGPAFLGLTGVSEAITRLVDDRTFASLDIPCAVTTVDLETAELLAIKHGLLRDAALATIAVPGVFPPRDKNGRTLVDGGIMDPVPVRLARSLASAHPVVAVALSPATTDWVQRPAPRLLSTLPFLGKYLARLRLARALQIFLRSVDISGALLTDLHLELSQPEVIIRPKVHHIGLLDRMRVSEVAQIGEAAAEEALPLIRETLNWRARVQRWFRKRFQGEGRYPYVT